MITGDENNDYLVNKEEQSINHLESIVKYKYHYFNINKEIINDIECLMLTIVNISVFKC